MKLLLDHNLSPRLVRLLADVYPDCAHVHDLGMDTASGTEVWRYAAEHRYTIASKDSDFHQRSLLVGAPRSRGCASVTAAWPKVQRL